MDNSYFDDDDFKKIGILIFLFMLVLYSIIGAYMDRKRPIIGHETGLIILLGCTISLILNHIADSFTELVSFNNDIFFVGCLPFIVFASGFNMKRKKFFQNISNIFKLGLLGTILTFIFYSVLTYLLFQFTEFEYTEDKVAKKIHLNAKQILFLCSILTSSNITIGLQSINPEETPKLYSVILGEGLLNDLMAILFLYTLAQKDNDLNQEFGIN